MATPFLQRLQAQLEHRMREKRFDMKSLSLAAGLSENYVSNIMRGRIKDPSLKRMQEIAAQLECSLEDLIADAPAASAARQVKADKDALVEAIQWVEGVSAAHGITVPAAVKGIVIAKLTTLLRSGAAPHSRETAEPLVSALIETALESASSSTAAAKANAS